MGFETMEMWDAMKIAKYRQTQDNLRKVVRNAQGSLDEAISSALNMVCEAAHAKVGTFWFYSRFGDGLIHPRASWGGSDIRGHTLKLGEGVAGQVIESGEPTIIVDCQKDPRWSGKVDAATGFSTKSRVCVPLVEDGIVFGCIQLINKMDGTLFDNQDLSFAQRLAEEIAEQFVAQNILTDGRVEQNVAVLFVDICDFAELAEDLEPDELADLLNQYLAFLTDRVQKNNGVMNKYIGAGAMAYWTPKESKDEAPAYMACRTALDMIRDCEQLCRKLQEKFSAEVHLQIGVSCGQAYVGNVGNSDLTNHTVVGAMVNEAVRIKAEAPAGMIYVSRKVSKALEGKAQMTPAGTRKPWGGKLSTTSMKLVRML